MGSLGQAWGGVELSRGRKEMDDQITYNLVTE